MLELNVVGANQSLVLRDFTAIIAGYTGRDQEAVNLHIQELADIGVPAPPHTPTFYLVDSSSITSQDAISVDATKSSGEVEPVYICAAGRYYLGVGSDHTDRELETSDIAESKRACPKPLGRNVIPVDDINALELGDFLATARADGGDYQRGQLSALMNPSDLLPLLHNEIHIGEKDFVLFGGTVPLLEGGFRYAERWELSLEAHPGAPPHNGLPLTHSYATDTKG